MKLKELYKKYGTSNIYALNIKLPDGYLHHFEEEDGKVRAVTMSIPYETAVHSRNVRTDKDIKDGVQVINYELNCLVGTNGQAPFISFGMYLDEAEEGVERDNLAKVINEIFTQRIAGFPNEKGVMVTQEFPKLLYFLDEDNIHDDSPYFWLTKKAIECTSKRMVPDYISAKKMRELKDGNVFPCMGCRSFLQPYYEDKNGKPTTKRKISVKEEAVEQAIDSTMEFELVT